MNTVHKFLVVVGDEKDELVVALYRVTNEQSFNYSHTRLEPIMLLLMRQCEI